MPGADNKDDREGTATNTVNNDNTVRLFITFIFISFIKYNVFIKP